MSNLFFKFVSEILASVALLIIGSALVLIARNCKIQLKTSTSVDEIRYCVTIQYLQWRATGLFFHTVLFIF